MGLAEVADIADIADILQTYCRHIADIADILRTYCRLRWIAANRGGKRRIMVKGVTGVFYDSTPLSNSSFCETGSW